VAAPPTNTPTIGPTATLEPYQYVVQPNDTLYYILQLFGYRTLDIVPDVLALNGMVNENDLAVNDVLLIPRQTPTPGPSPMPIPTSANPNVTPVDPNVTPDFRGCSPANRCMSQDGLYWMHEVREGDTVAGIAFEYDTTVQDILRDNGLSDTDFINPGDILRVFIRVTLTPTLTPTGGPGSTATPTPTLNPPSLLAPANGAVIARDQTAALQWVATQPLRTSDYYLVQIRDASSGEETRFTTRSNVLRLPSDLKPEAGQSILYDWRVVIVNGDSPQSPVISGQGGMWQFTWGP
jgi:LysM repeat protein